MIAEVSRFVAVQVSQGLTVVCQRGTRGFGEGVLFYLSSSEK